MISLNRICSVLGKNKLHTDMPLPRLAKRMLLWSTFYIELFWGHPFHVIQAWTCFFFIRNSYDCIDCHKSTQSSFCRYFQSFLFYVLRRHFKTVWPGLVYFLIVGNRQFGNGLLGGGGSINATELGMYSPKYAYNNDKLYLSLENKH